MAFLGLGKDAISKVLDALAKAEALVHILVDSNVINEREADTILGISGQVTTAAVAVKRVKEAEDRPALVRALTRSVEDLFLSGSFYIKNEKKRKEFEKYVAAARVAALLL